MSGSRTVKIDVERLKLDVLATGEHATEISKAAGGSKSLINNAVQRGVCSTLAINAIANALGYTADRYIIKDDPKPTPKPPSKPAPLDGFEIAQLMQEIEEIDSKARAIGDELSAIDKHLYEMQVRTQKMREVLNKCL